MGMVITVRALEPRRATLAVFLELGKTKPKKETKEEIGEVGSIA